MEEGNFHFGNVQWPLVDTAIGLDHDLNSVDMLARNELDATGQESHNLVEVSTEIDVQQEASKQSYSNIFITALHLNKLKKTFGTEGEKGHSNGVDAILEVDHKLNSIEMLVATDVRQHTGNDINLLYFV